MSLIHASTVAFDRRAVLLSGRSGCGKSDLALRLIESGATLVADDQTLVQAEAAQLIAQTPAATAGLLELRGLGLVRFAHTTNVPIALAVDLDPEVAPVRLPEPMVRHIEGIAVPLLVLNAFELSTPIKIRAWLGLCGEGLAMDQAAE